MKKNTPLLSSVVFGVFYFLLTAGAHFSRSILELFIFLMLFLPGLTFPFSTFAFSSMSFRYHEIRIVLFIILSVADYYAMVWLYSGEGYYSFLPAAAGFLGALLYHLAAKLLLNAPGALWKIFVTALLSGAAFLPYVFSQSNLLLLGMALLLWTVINGWLINASRKLP